MLYDDFCKELCKEFNIDPDNVPNCKFKSKYFDPVIREYVEYEFTVESNSEGEVVVKVE